MENVTLLIITYVIIAIILNIVVLYFMRKRRLNKLRKEIERLDIEKNEVETMPILSELAKVETIIKNDKMEEKYKSWLDRFDYIKREEITKINDMIVNLDIFIDKSNYNEYISKIAAVEIELYKARTKADTLLKEIKEINLSEEKYRRIIIKLKAKYRDLLDVFEKDKDIYEDIKEVIELQFENIEKRFQDFEEYMEMNDYHEVFHIVKAIDTMIDHMGIVVSEVPDLILLAKKLIPKRIEQITEIYEDMMSKEFPLEHLNIQYNIEESLKNVNKIIDRIKVLNLEECMFELKTMLEYLDSIFNEFELERKSKKVYEEENDVFANKLEKTNTVVKDIYNGLDDIKSTYDLTDNDVTVIDDVNKRLELLNVEYKNTEKKLKKKKLSYSAIVEQLVVFTNDLIKVEDDLDTSLKSLGNMYEDEVRAREQLDEIQELLKQSKIKIRSYKLPLISNNYFVELSEANEAILEIIKELEKKPIAIKVLNTRVDTARDLVLKLYNTTNEMIKTARLAELSIVYGNRYRCIDINIDSGLDQAEMLFFKGSYQKALDTTMNTLERVDKEIRKKVMTNYEKNI